MSINRRTFLASVGLGAAGLVAPSPLLKAPAVAASTGPYVAYSRSSFFRSRVTGAPVDSAATDSFRTFMRNTPEQNYSYPIIKGLNGDPWGMPYAQGGANDPIWKLVGHVPSHVADLSSQGFHAPSWFGAQLTETKDSPFVVLDRGSGMTVYGFHANVVGSQLIDVQDAGCFLHASNGLDRRNPLTDCQRNDRARGIISDAMVIRRDLVDHAITSGTGLGHVLHMFFVETDSSAGYCHPMVANELGKTGWGAEGRRIAIDPTIDLSTRGLSLAGLAIARTLKRHGCYLGDNAGSGSSLKAEQATATHNPWAGLDINRQSLSGITWDDFVVLPAGWQG
jgi:hypothetical protein